MEKKGFKIAQKYNKQSWHDDHNNQCDRYNHPPHRHHRPKTHSGKELSSLRQFSAQMGETMRCEVRKVQKMT